MVPVTPERFEELVADALDALPPDARADDGQRGRVRRRRPRGGPARPLRRHPAHRARRLRRGVGRAADARPHHRVPAARSAGSPATRPRWSSRCASPWSTRWPTTSASTTTASTSSAGPDAARAERLRGRPRGAVSRACACGARAGPRCRACPCGGARPGRPPTMPAWLSSSAGTTGVRQVSFGRNLSAFLDTPPPMMNRSGQSRSSTMRRYSSTRDAHSSQSSSRRSRHRVGRPVLGVAAPQGEVAELGVGHQAAVDHDGRADAGAEGDGDDHAGLAPGRTEAGLGLAGGVGVVDDRDRAARGLADERRRRRGRSRPCRGWPRCGRGRPSPPRGRCSRSGRPTRSASPPTPPWRRRPRGWPARG